MNRAVAVIVAAGLVAAIAFAFVPTLSLERVRLGNSDWAQSDDLPFGWLSTLDADLAFSTDILTTRSIVVRDFTSRIRLDDAVLEAGPATADVAGGSLLGHMNIRADRNPPEVRRGQPGQRWHARSEREHYRSRRLRTGDHGRCERTPRG